MEGGREGGRGGGSTEKENITSKYIHPHILHLTHTSHFTISHPHSYDFEEV